MQYEEFVSSLNNRQLEAVETSSQFVRVVAGAGSGKTRVLTYRISYLISQMNVAPWKILAITFTNKVANEMKNRVVSIVPEAQKDLTIKTFHSFAAMFLRREIGAINYPANFTILDEEDQLKIIKDLVVEHGYRKGDPLVKQAINYISKAKLREQYPDDIKIAFEKFENEKLCLELYTEYEETKARQYALDFDDLLLKTNQILSSFPAIRSKWQDRFDHILIDEFQDTNDTEYKMIQMLLRSGTSLYVVGDPDQTIYTWRGANQDIIINLNKSFHNVETIILDENYRSTQTILDSANKLIANNKFRVPKDLFTNNGQGEPIIVRCFDSGMGEAEYVAREIMSLKNLKGFNYSDIAILYRSNYITLDFEKAFIAKSIPYVIYGSLKFYQRMEIKDVLAYFRLINNKNDDISFERIINVPRRGIGDKTIQTIKDEARKHNQCLYDYIFEDYALEDCPNKAIHSLRSLITRINLTRDKIKENIEMFSKVLEEMIQDIGYYIYLQELDEGEDRIENVKSLFEDIRHFLQQNPEATFDDYLQNVALASAQDEMKEGDKVTLMTAHTAKGLEFPIVFIVRFNQGVFPNNRALFEDGFKAMEEERRLAYVAMTRAKKRLYITLSNSYSYVTKSELSESQFLKESGNPLRAQSTYSFAGGQKKNSYQSKYSFDDAKKYKGFTFDDEPKRQDFSQVVNDIAYWEVGDIVIHKKLGRGVVISVEEDNILEVEFDEQGKKTILGNHPMVNKGKK